MAPLLAIAAVAATVVAVHEFGHVVAARLLGVQVAAIRVGLGPAVLSRRIGGIPVRLCLLPVVVLADIAGRDPDPAIAGDDPRRSLQARPLPVRAAILLAGPACNVALPVLLWFAYALRITTVPAPVVGTVADESAAAAAGIRPGDRIVAIDGKDVRSFWDLRRRVAAAPGRELRVQLVRGGTRLERFVMPRKTIRHTASGRAEVVGAIGVYPDFYEAQVGIVDPDSPAARAGLRTGDVLTSVDGEPLGTVEDLERRLAAMGRRSQVRLTYLRADPVPTRFATFYYYRSRHAQLLASRRAITDTGIRPANTFVRAVDPGSPAEEAGIRPGDRIEAVDGTPFSRWEYLENRLEAAGEAPVHLRVVTPGNPPRTVVVRQRAMVTPDASGISRRRLWFGARPYGKRFRPPPDPVRGRFAFAVDHALAATARDIRRVLQTAAQVLTLEPWRAGLHPLADAARTAAATGELPAAFYLSLSSLVSIAAALLHMLPLPMLDGGRLLLDAVEILRRRRIGGRARVWIAVAVLAVLGLAALSKLLAPAPMP